jgi:hypothetical protein
MKTLPLILIVLIAIAQPALAQDHLIPDRDALVHPDPYHLKVRDVLLLAFEPGVTSRVIVLPAFRGEYAVGLRTTKEGVEAFVLEASSSIWDVECLKMTEEGRVLVLDDEGKRLPLEQDELYQELKKTTPSDHRKITTNRRARPIPASLAAKIDALWQEMLLNVRYPAETVDGCDGETYCFSALVPRRGQLSGHVWSPEPDSKTGRLVALTEAMADYASGKADLKRLTQQLEKASKP